MDLGEHAAFIWLSYAAVVITLVGLALRLWLDGRRHSRALAELENRDVRQQADPSKS